eukprot:UN29107
MPSIKPTTSAPTLPQPTKYPTVTGAQVDSNKGSQNDDYVSFWYFIIGLLLIMFLIYVIWYIFHSSSDRTRETPSMHEQLNKKLSTLKSKDGMMIMSNQLIIPAPSDSSEFEVPYDPNHSPYRRPRKNTRDSGVAENESEDSKRFVNQKRVGIPRPIVRSSEGNENTRNRQGSRYNSIEINKETKAREKVMKKKGELVVQVVRVVPVK